MSKAFDKGVEAFERQDYDLAIASYSEAIRLNPNWAEAYNNRGLARRRRGDYDKAIADFSEAIHLNPKRAEAYNNRGNTYRNKGDYDNAIADFGEAIRLVPNYATAYNNLALLLAVCPNANVRNGEKAVEYARKACELNGWKRWNDLNTLAAAYAEAGDFGNAVKWQRKCLELEQPKDALDRARQRLDLYSRQKPYHEEKR